MTEDHARTLADLAAHDAERQIAAARRCARDSVREATPTLIELATSPHAEVRGAALHALGTLNDETLVPSFIHALADPEFEVRSNAGWALVELGSQVRPAIEAVLACCENDDARQMALLVLEHLDPRSIPPPDYASGGALARLSEDSVAVRALAVAHDMNNKLQSFYSSVPWLTEQLCPDAPSDTAELLDELLHCAERIAALLRQAVALLSARGVAALPVAQTEVGDPPAIRAFYGLLHDLNNLLTVLHSYFELISETDRCFSPEGVEELRRLAEAKSALLTQSRELGARAFVGRSRAPRTPKEVSTADLARRLAWTLRRLADRRGVKTHVSISPKVASSVLLDEALFERVVDNLLTNAVKYTERGSITVEIEGADDSLVVSVRDTGRGIAPSLLARLFEHGASDEASRAPHSFGIGLAGVAQLLRDVGGRIEASSEVGVGSTFVVRFPAEMPPPS